MLDRLTTMVDLRVEHLFPVSDQGMRPICVPMAITGAHEIVRLYDDGPPPYLLAPDALWTHAWKCDLATETGTSLFAIGNALRDQGQPELTAWPLDSTTVGASTTPSGLSSPPWMRATLEEFSYDRSKLMSELNDRRPMVLIVHVTDEFHYADGSTGRVKSPDSSSTGQGLHAILCLGYAEGENSSVHFLVRNSWGESWGLHGYGWLPDDYIENFCVGMGLVVDPLH